MERQTALEAAVSIVVVVGFIGVLAVLTTMYSTDGSLGPTGGYALVAALVGFIIVMSGAGLALTRMDSDGGVDELTAVGGDDAGDDTDDNAAGDESN
ncbi:hypothetical protein HLRTI_000250 [Halorhabdus tiamatea SARL4B]|uniref:Uncharacterized protein n=1 Tax=Halorhabdus tiamatea SARL4B TaxID=1033806 RepID=F7PJZ8_9EURY|nr:hypothetical protein [Halorhabdus tiamatea]ERJ07527.1 hypothetical protein HLRTI_000250 [Halorhabdus tiamatea SARL4B]CCQ33525.1 hypothetical protein HTIA_1397 [Halorhabdus tiamatea SARL4B]